MTAQQIPDAALKALLDAVYRQYHYDFRQYAEGSLRRRLAHAMALFGVEHLEELTARVLADAQLFTRLLDYFTVQVSDLFRDPDYFRVMREQVVPHLGTYPAIKVWVAGCSTGEEAYSLAIILAEEGLLDRSLIYATDINADSLETASRGIYALDRMAKFSESYLAAGGKQSLSAWYTTSQSAAVMDPALRKRILFSDHSLATDSVFAEVELVSCRNVLIYFDDQLHARALALMTEALGRRGFLGLGSRETLRFSAGAAAFDDFAPAVRIYRKR